MNKEKSITILIQAAQVATQKGAFSLSEAGIISQAAEFLKASNSQPKEKKEDKTPE